MSDYTDDGESRLDITTVSTDELLQEMSDARRLHTIRLSEGNWMLAELHAGVIDMIVAELAQRRKPRLAEPGETKEGKGE